MHLLNLRIPSFAFENSCLNEKKWRAIFSKTRTPFTKLFLHLHLCHGTNKLRSWCPWQPDRANTHKQEFPWVKTKPSYCASKSME